MLAAVLALIIELLISFFLGSFAATIVEAFPFISLILYHLIAVALVEELSKFLMVQERVLKDPNFDEPVDAMLYMIIVALGFAALENLFYLMPVLFPASMEGSISLGQAAIITIFRFLGATFLHALCSGALGFFLALSIFKPKSKTKMIKTSRNVRRRLMDILLGYGLRRQTTTALLYL